jgi:hypothetical protein
MDLENHHHLISDPEQSYDQPLEPTECSEESEAVRTLFVSGLPLDVKYREVYNLFRHYPGFVSVTLSYAGVDRKLVSILFFKSIQHEQAFLPSFSLLIRF